MAKAPSHLVREVEALLSPDAGKTPREIHRAIPLTGRCSVYHALAQLIEDGRVIFEGEMGQRRYRLAGAER
jgi:hypothetical protein